MILASSLLLLTVSVELHRKLDVILTNILYQNNCSKFNLSTIDRAVQTTWLYAACGRNKRISEDAGDNQLQFVPSVFSKDLVKVHADFNKAGNNENDIALVRTTKPYKCKKDRINAACLPTDEVRYFPK